MEQISLSLLQGGFALAIVVGVVEAIKRATALASRYVPLVSIAVGVVVCGFLVGWTLAGVLAGVVVGLASCGLWDLGKRTVGGK